MLTWVKVNSDRWETEEGVTIGTQWRPDFYIAYGGAYGLKMRSARKPMWFDTLQEAKDYAESI